MSLLRDKIARINISQILADDEAKQASEAAVAAESGSEEGQSGKRIVRTAVGIHAESIYRDELLAKENEKLKGELEAFQDSEPTKKLNPKTIKASHWANRNESSFHTKEFESLKAEIESSAGNVQPIKVRKISGKPCEYEIVFGHRRHRACLELGLDVLALIEDLSDADLFTQMDRENRQRADLRPYEQGVIYAKALSEGLFPSMRKLADSLGVSVGGVSTLVALSKLPTDVLGAFESPLDIQFDWGPAIGAALQKNPDFVLNRARDIAVRKPRPSASQVLKELVSVDGVQSLNTSQIKPSVLTGKNGAIGKIAFNVKRGSFEISLKGLNTNRLSDIEKAVKGLLD